MFVRRSLLVVAVTLAVVRCADQPTALNPQPTTLNPPTSPQFLTWASDATLDFTSTTSHTSRSGAMALTPPLSLDKYTVSFWAVRGKSRSITINYKSSVSTQTYPFLTLTTTDPRFVPGVGEIAVGDSVLITVTVDTTKIGVRLEPTGLQFGTTSEMKLWYAGANGDLNGDGIADVSDADLEAQLLGLWYREYTTEPWEQVSASHAIGQKMFVYALPHFCEYAVAALREWAVGW